MFSLKACGLVKNLALMTYITTEVDEQQIVRLTHNMGVESVSLLGGEEMYLPNTYTVMLNGKIPSVICNS